MVLRVGAVLLVLALTISALVEAVQTRVPRLLPRWLWAVVIVIVPLIGPAAWFLLGRVSTRGTGPTRPTSRRGPVAPDDDPTFLRHLDDEAWVRRNRERREQHPDGEHPGDQTPA